MLIFIYSSLRSSTAGLALLVGVLSTACDSSRKPQPADEAPKAADAKTVFSPEILDIAERLSIPAEFVQQVRNLPQNDLNRMSSHESHVFINNFSIAPHRPVSRCTRQNARVVPGFGSVRMSCPLDSVTTALVTFCHEPVARVLDFQRMKSWPGWAGMARET